MQQGLFKAGVAEMFGTFFLTFIGAGAICALRFETAAGVGSESTPLILIALAHGLALMVAVYATAHISGGSINPAVNVGLLIAGKLSAVGAVVYTIFQCAGAIAAGFLLRAMFWRWGAQDIILGTPFFEKITQLKAGLIEASLTFVLMYAIMACAVDPNRRGKQFFGFCIGMTLAMCIMVGGPMTGAALNPARYFGTAVAAGDLSQAAVYWVAPIIGAALAAAVYRFVFLASQTAPEDEA